MTRTLYLDFDVGTLRHLGGQMYGGGLLKPVAELVANAWDADATAVEITLPTGLDGVVEVADNGHGMTFDECQNLYLTVGVDRRSKLASDKTRSGNRKVMGRKGVGKLSVLQVSSLVEVDTVTEAEQGKDLWRTHFQIPYGTFLNRAGTTPERSDVTVLVDAAPPVDMRFPGDSRTGTRTTLRDLHIGRAPNVDQFVRSLHVRFAGVAERDDFTIRVNGTRVPTLREAIEAQAFEFYYDGEDEVDELGTVRWWVGFTPDPQRREDLQGVGVYVRGRIAVDRPFFFNLTRGFTGQLGKEYMTGAVFTDAPDEGEDLIATDRGDINWEHPVGQALQGWGQNLVREHAAIWERERGKRRLVDLQPDPRLIALIDKLTPEPKNQALTLLRRLAQIPNVSKDQIDHTARVLLSGHQHQEFMDALRAINASDVESLPALLDQWQVLEALLYLPVVRSRVDVIVKLEKLIEEKAREFPDIFDALKASPELLRPQWEPLAWNARMEKIVAEVFERSAKGMAQGLLRPDVLCLSDSLRYVVVELKRPGLRVSQDEVLRMLDYMRLIDEEIQASDANKGAKLEAMLICDALDDDAAYLLEQSTIEKMTWQQFLKDAQRAHAYILERVVERVPEGDPRAEPYVGDIGSGAADNAPPGPVETAVEPARVKSGRG